MILPQSTGLKFTFAFFTTLLLFGLPLNASAKKLITEEWQISADKITRYENPRSIIAEGNIILVKREKLPPKSSQKTQKGTDWAILLGETPKPEQVTPKDLETEGKVRYKTQITIKADWMAYDITLGTIKARGHVDILSGEDRLYAEQGVVNLSRTTGVFSNATLIRNKNDLHLQGKTIEKTGVNTYHITDGWAITCKLKKNETPPWSLSSSDTKITQGGYAVMKNAKFNIKGVPVLYSPYMTFPVKNTRETGFLIPVISASSNNGFGINLPFFYNISDSADMTFYTDYYAKRGFMPGAEFRYVLSPEDKGTFAGNFLRDRLSDPSETQYYSDTGFTHTNKDRYWFRGKMDKSFGNGWTTRVDLDIVSDRDYLTEFNSGIYTGFEQSHKQFLNTFGRGFQNKTADQRQNTASVLKSWPGMSLISSLVAINDVRHHKTSPTPLWQLPGVDFTGASLIGDSDFTMNWDTSYVNFWRKDGVGGQRVDLYPQLSAPIPLGPYLESRAQIGLRETYYDIQTYGDGTWDQGSNPSRTLYKIHTEIGTTLARDFGIPMGEYKGINHKIRPSIQYNYIPDVNQDKLPSFSGIDRVAPDNTITYEINNFFTLFKQAGILDNDATKDYGYLKVKQSYYLGNIREKITNDTEGNRLPSDETDKSLSPINVRLGWIPIEHLDVSYKTDFDIYGHGFLRHSVEGTYDNQSGGLVDINYQYDKLQDIEQINLHLKTWIWDNIRGEYRLSQSLSQSVVNEQDVSVLYQAPCWSAELRSTYTETDTAIYLIFNLSNISTPFGMSM